jgi:flagellar biosynthesis protein FliO
MDSARLEIVKNKTKSAAGVPLSPRHFLRPVADCLRRLRRSTLWTRLAHSSRRWAASKRRVLVVRESAALGDRRFVSVIQFECQRFLIGCSPSSVTLLAQLPDALPDGGDRAGITEDRQ